MQTNKSQLTSAEMGKLWASYIGNTMGKCVLGYYLKHVDDSDIRKVLENALGLANSFNQTIETIFSEEKFPIPVGFTDGDVNLGAPRLFHDEFYLHYLKYLGKAGASIYCAAIPMVTRKDVRDFFVHCLHDTVKLLTDVSDVLESKCKLMNTPPIPTPQKADFVNEQNFLNGFWGDVRPLHGLEIAHLYDNLNNDITSRALVLGFVQGARNEKVQSYLERGMDINQKHIEILSNKLNKASLPSPTLLDHLVNNSATPPFSDKLMVFHKIDMFSMKIRDYANGASVNGRHDIGAMYAKCIMDVSLYVEDGANIMIDHGWMEKPPEAAER